MSAGNRTWLERYTAGDRAAVWTEMRALGEQIRQPEYLPDAVAVCDEMARRARTNIERFISIMSGQGYVFLENNEDRETTPLTAPMEEIGEFVSWADELLGLPLTVQSFLRIVGEVWLVGVLPGRPESRDWDALCIEVTGGRYGKVSAQQARERLGGEYEDWEADLPDWQQALRDDGHSDEVIADYTRFTLEVAPDWLTKGNTSGGGPEGFPVPDRSVDGVYDSCGVYPDMPFVDYLNMVFSRGGFARIDEANRQLQKKVAATVIPHMLEL